MTAVFFWDIVGTTSFVLYKELDEYGHNEQIWTFTIIDLSVRMKYL